MSSVIDSIERAQLRRVPNFAAGDRVKVHFQVIEGTRRRTQVFEGVVIKRQGHGARETFTVRKQSFGVGVERTFPLHSPKIERIEVAARGDVRRAKLYYLRDRVGKRARVRERGYVGPEETVEPGPAARARAGARRRAATRRAEAARPRRGARSGGRRARGAPRAGRRDGAAAEAAAPTPRAADGDRARGRAGVSLKLSRGNSLVEFVLIVVIALGLALGIQAFLVKPYRIPSESMEPTLAIGQRVLVNRLGNDFSDPHVGEIVVFHPPQGAVDGSPACGVPVSPAASSARSPPRRRRA